MLLFEVLRQFRVRHQVKPHQLHGAFPVVVRLPISSLSDGWRQSSHYFPGPLGGFSGPVAGLGSGFGAARVGAGPVITSKSKLPRCMEDSLVCGPKAVPSSADFDMTRAKYESRLDGRLLGLATGARS